MNDSTSVPAEAGTTAGMDDDERPAWRANARNNTIRAEDRPVTWRGVRDELWKLLDPVLEEGARVAIVGAGNADDVPLARITQRSSHVDLIDIDAAAAHGAVARAPEELRDRLHVVEQDVTDGAADVVLRAAAADLPPAAALPEVQRITASSTGPVGDGDYDVVVGDMLYTQLLQAGLVQLELALAVEADWMRQYDPLLTAALVARLHASAPDGHVVHVHDLACWSARQEQPVPLDEVLADPFWHVTRLYRQDWCDPQLALAAAGARVETSAWWRWPAGPWHEYLVRAVVARRAG